MLPRLLRSAPFFRLWSAATVSELGNAVTQLALPLTAIVLLHASPLQVGILVAATSLPYLLIGLAAGVLVDRSRPLALMIITDLLSAAFLVSIPAAYLAGRLSMVQVYVVAFSAGSLSVIFGVAQQASVHRLVPRPDLVDANSKLGVSVGTAQLAGPGLGGLLVGLLSAPLAIAIDALSFVFSAVVVSGIPRPERDIVAGPRPGIWSDVKEGLRFIFRHPVTRGLAGMLAVFHFFGSLFESAYLLYFVRVLHFSPTIIGLAIAAGGAGGLLGAAAAPWVGRRFGLGRAIAFGCFPLTGLLIPLAPIGFALPWIMFAEFTQLFAIMVGNASQLGLRQAITPTRIQGRMTASMRFLILSFRPPGALLGGLVATRFGLRTALFVGAAGCLLPVLPVLYSGIVRIRVLPAQVEGAAAG